MLSVVIATLDSETTLLPTLAGLVPGAIAGLVSEVLIADGGSRDGTAAVADVAGCKYLSLLGALGSRLANAAAATRSPWLLFLRPGTVLDGHWTEEVGRFVEQASPNTRAAVFRRAAPARPALIDALSLLATALGARPRPEQGLLVSREFYRQLGGHSAKATDPETDMLRRIGRRRIATLASSAAARRQTARADA